MKPVTVLVHPRSDSAHAEEYNVTSFEDIRPEHFTKACILKAMDDESFRSGTYTKAVIWRDGLGSWLETSDFIRVRIVMEDV